MKIAILADTHIDARNSSDVFNNHFLEFFDKQFFPYLEEHDIKTIIHLGDLFDRRKYINFSTLSLWQRIFEEFNKYETHLILGNHDVYHKNNNEINSPSLLLNIYDNISIYESAQELVFDECKILFLPWINDENREISLRRISLTDAKIVMGHLAVKGFELTNGVVNTDGFAISDFAKFHRVYTGHFHKKSVCANIHYLGSSSKITWSDHGNDNGFHIFDTGTGDIEFIENKSSLFEKIFYQEKNAQKVPDVTGKYVKIIVKDKTNHKAGVFEKYVEKINEQNPVEVAIIDEDQIDTSTDQSVDETKDTLTILKDYINSLEIACDKNKLNILFSELYQEANDVK